MYDQVARRWSALGLPGEAPSVRAYESDQPIVYHEEGSFEPGARKKPEESPPAPSM
jgi:4-hydroxy-3-polyprenylbenzoate decarboxylase